MISRALIFRLITLTIIPVMKMLLPLTIESVNNHLTAVRLSNLHLQTRNVKKLGSCQTILVDCKQANAPLN